MQVAQGIQVRRKPPLQMTKQESALTTAATTSAAARAPGGRKSSSTRVVGGGSKGDGSGSDTVPAKKRAKVAAPAAPTAPAAPHTVPPETAHPHDAAAATVLSLPFTKRGSVDALLRTAEELGQHPALALCPIDQPGEYVTSCIGPFLSLSLTALVVTARLVRDLRRALVHWLWHWALPDMTADRRAALQAAAHAPTVTYAELQLLLRDMPATAAAVAALLPRVAAVGKAVSPTNIEGELTLAEDLASAIRAFLHARGQLDSSDDDGRDARPLPSPLLSPLPLPGTHEDENALFARLHALGPLAVPLSLPQYQVGEQLAYIPPPGGLTSLTAAAPSLLPGGGAAGVSPPGGLTCLTAAALSLFPITRWRSSWRISAWGAS